MKSLEEVELAQLFVVCSIEIPAKNVQQEFKFIEIIASA